MTGPQIQYIHHVKKAFGFGYGPGLFEPHWNKLPDSMAR